MFTAIGLIIGTLGKILGLVSSVETAKITADAEVETASIQTMGAVEQRWWFVAILLPIFAIPYAIYDGKAVLWDNVIMHGSSYTPALHGSLDTLNWIIVTGLFLQAGLNRLKA